MYFDRGKSQWALLLDEIAYNFLNDMTCPYTYVIFCIPYTNKIVNGNCREVTVTVVVTRSFLYIVLLF